MKKNDANYSNLPLPNRKIYDLITEKANGNVTSFAKMISISQQKIDRLFKKDKRNDKFPSVSGEIKKALKSVFNIDEVWLLTKDTDILNSESKECSGNYPTKSFIKGKPYYNVDFIGGFDIVLNDQTAIPEYLINFEKYHEADCWCNITGHSMEPLISNGDIIAIKEIKDWKDFILYGEVYGIITSDMRTVKIVTKSQKGDDYFHLIPVNKSEEYQPQDIPVKLIEHVYKVLGCMKKI